MVANACEQPYSLFIVSKTQYIIYLFALSVLIRLISHIASMWCARSCFTGIVLSVQRAIFVIIRGYDFWDRALSVSN